MLPEGWVQVTHASGMPLYLNRQARVCTLSRPYFIGQSSARVFIFSNLELKN
jgi:microprocessor complex subunit DGCR8